VFKGVLSRTSLLCDKEVLPCVPAGTLEDALVFYEGKARIYAVLRTTVQYYLRGDQRILTDLSSAVDAMCQQI
jgi:hypothetical protein